ncbi:Short-chain dehydrogenase/reductase SDR [Sesbania bispinosa]|nr:Short-chain dehydrogenase/reductase SDR [Sesbania bispinosa]
MVAIYKILNVVLPPLSLILLPIFMIPFLFFKLFIYVEKLVYTENLARKVVLVTGAASGIGEQIAYEYARRGAMLSLVDIRKENLVAVSDKARSLGSPDVTIIGADVSKLQDCKRFVDETVNHFGRRRAAKVEDLHDVSEFTPTMDINFWGAVYGTLYAIPHLKNSKGKIIVIASACGWFPTPTLSIYNASKAAVISFFETLRIEVGWCIGITIVTPGFLKTELAFRAIENEAILGRIPMGSAFECAKAIVKSACRGDIKENLVAVSDKARSLGSPDVTIIGADVSKPQDCNRFVDETVNHFGRLDHLVNNAGVGRGAKVEDLHHVSEFTPIMDTNFWGAVYGTLYAIPHLKNSKGKIIEIASACGWFPLPTLSIYNASKAAVINFFETLRIEVGGSIGITIATPGFVKTDMALRAIENELVLFYLAINNTYRLVWEDFQWWSAFECAKTIVKSACRGDRRPNPKNATCYFLSMQKANVAELDTLSSPRLLKYNDLAFVFSIFPPLGLVLLLCILPPYLLFKTLYFVVRSMFSENVAGKVILITGASSGIGEHLAYEYGRRGARLALVARRENRLKEVATNAKSLGSPDVITIPADVSIVQDCKRFVDLTVNHFGQWLIESEMTQGKFLSKEGRMVLDQEMRDVQVSLMPIRSVTEAAEAIVKSACRGDSFLTEPAWIKTTFYLKIFCPEV